MPEKNMKMDLIRSDPLLVQPTGTLPLPCAPRGPRSGYLLIRIEEEETANERRISLTSSNLSRRAPVIRRQERSQQSRAKAPDTVNNKDEKRLQTPANEASPHQYAGRGDSETMSRDRHRKHPHTFTVYRGRTNPPTSKKTRTTTCYRAIFTETAAADGQPRPVTRLQLDCADRLVPSIATLAKPGAQNQSSLGETGPAGKQRRPMQSEERGLAEDILQAPPAVVVFTWEQSRMEVGGGRRGGGADGADRLDRVRNGSDRKGAVGRERFAQLSSEVAFPLPTVPLVVGRMSIAAAAT
ncbi:unnamed protein product [Boreogadus saida]